MLVETVQIEIMKKIKLIISGGGTGGHIFPAVSIAKSIEDKLDNIDILFVGANNRMEMKKIPSLGYNIVGLPIIGFQRNLNRRNILFPFKLILSLFKAFSIIKNFKPDLVIGTGGYASGPLLFVASIFRIPSLIQEQNSYPGITNRILGRYVNKICVAYTNMERYFNKEKLVLTGNPIRKDILNFKDKVILGKQLFNINNTKKTVLVIGGSLGAKTINNAILNNISNIKESRINLIWQTGELFHLKAKESINKLNCQRLKTYDFIKKMDFAYAVADIIISRAGAIAISELCCVGKPVILVPSPNVSENHQFKNAQSLVNKKAALLVEDRHASCKLVETLINLVSNNELQDTLSSNIKKLAINDAADSIVNLALAMRK